MQNANGIAKNTTEIIYSSTFHQTIQLTPSFLEADDVHPGGGRHPQDVGNLFVQGIALDVNRGGGWNVDRVLDEAHADNPRPAEILLTGGEHVTFQLNADFLGQ